MAIAKFKNRVADTTTDTTSPLDLDATVPVGYPSYQTPVDAGCVSGAPSYWMWETLDGSEWQLFRGVWTNATPDTLTVATAIDGSDGPGNTVTIPSGTKRVFQVAPAALLERMVLKVGLTSATNTTNAGFQKVPFNAVADTDTHACWDTSNKRFTPSVPGWYNVNISVRVTSTGGLSLAAIYKNGSVEMLGHDLGSTVVGAIASALVYCDGVSDYIEGWIYCSAVRAYDTTAGYMGMRIVGPLAGET